MLVVPVVRELLAAQVRFVVVGGVAANLQGSPRLTYDLDICYETSDDSIRRLADVLASWNAYMRGVERGLPFIMDARQFRITPVMTLTTVHGDIDVMDRIEGVGGYADVLAASAEVELDEIRFRVLGLEGLVRAKRAAGRPKDRDQLPELEALLDLKRGKR